MQGELELQLTHYPLPFTTPVPGAARTPHSRQGNRLLQKLSNQQYLQYISAAYTEDIAL